VARMDTSRAALKRFTPANEPFGDERARAASLASRAPPQLFFVISAIFHYLGPAFAVLLFTHILPLGVAWLRIASAALVFAVWRRPWRYWRTLSVPSRRTIVCLGIVLAAMNASFYLAINRLPLSTVGAIEFLGPIGLAAAGMRTRRNFQALALGTLGVYILTDVRIAGEPAGFIFAFVNCALFVLYVILGHRIARSGDVSAGANGIDRLGASMLIAMLAALPIGIWDAVPAFSSPVLLAAAAGVGISSSVIPYVCDQLAMARLHRATFALLLSLLPATATVIGIAVLRQIPSIAEAAGVVLVILGVAIHREHG
jgi:inner membrane transporter RhtA